MENKLLFKNDFIDNEIQKIKKEKEIGVPWDYFMALVNLSKEFHSNLSNEKIIDTWIKYRLYFFICQIKRDNILSSKFCPT